MNIRSYPAEVHRVIDGDTVVFDLDIGFKTRKRVKVRLLGVDTAETYGVDKSSRQFEKGKEHEQFVHDWLSDANSLTVRTDEKGSFGRWLGEVFNEEQESLNDALLDQFNVRYNNE